MYSLYDIPGKISTLKRNEFLVEKGKIDTNLYFVESGSLRIFIEDDFKEQNIRFGYQQNLVVTLDSFLTSKPTNYYIQAIKKTTVKIVSKNDLNVFLEIDGNQSIWKNILENLVCQLLVREIDILITSPIERYRRVLKRSPTLFQEIPHKHIANYLRMSAETLSRLKKS